jgi:serine protease
LSDEFVPGEAIVRVKSSPRAGNTTYDSAQALAARYAWRRKAGEAGRGMLVAMPTPSRAVMQAQKPIVLVPRADGLKVPPSLQRKWETLQFVKMLRVDPAVQNAELNRIYRAQAVPNDPLYGVQRWHYEMMQLPSAWDITTGSPGVIVAVVDTGVGPHPDLSANLIGGFDFISNPANTDGDGIDQNADDPGCEVFGGVYSFHGTHVAGTVAAVTNNASGVAGVGRNVHVMPVRVLENCTGGTAYDILQGVRFAAGLVNDSGQVPPQRADVINMSYGALSPCTAAEADLYSQVRAQGVILVAAAGNDDTSEVFAPASCPGVISVSSVTPNRTRAPYSNYGASWVDIAAPGGDLTTDLNGDGRADGIMSTFFRGIGSNRQATYAVQQGTSMAAPHVAGVMGLMKSVNPALTPQQIDTLLGQGILTDDIGAPGPDELGIGLANALKAVRAASAAPPVVPPTLTAAPTSLNFGDVGAQAEVILANGGGGTLTVSSILTSANWISVTALSTDSSGLGRYRVSVTRGVLQSGLYSGWVDFVSTAGTVRVSVLMQVAVAAGPPDAGMQYALLLDASDFTPVEQVEVLVTGHAVPYRFDLVDSGDYYVLSGTDMNNDMYICDEAEACGAYRSESDPYVISVNGEVVGIDFISVFRANVQEATAAGPASDSPPPRGFKRR